MDAGASLLKESRRRWIVAVFPAKRTVGDQVRVEADIFTDGHDAIAASLLAHREGSDEWTEIPMRPLVNDRWEASFRVASWAATDTKFKGGSITLRPGDAIC